MLGGGIPVGSTVLVVGGSGCGKNYFMYAVFNEWC